MVLQITAAPSSRVRKKTPLRRSASSPFASRRPDRGSPAKARGGKSKKHDPEDNEDDELFSERLEDHGLIHALATDQNLRDVPQYLIYIQGRMFDAIPDRSGMSSTRISEVLNYRKNLPPIVTTAHVHALSTAPTTTEREIAELVNGGTLRKISIPGYGLGSKAIGDCVVSKSRWAQMVHDATNLDADIKAKYIQVLDNFPSSLTIPASTFTSSEASALIQAGFLTSASRSATAISRPDSSTIGTLASLSAAGSRAAAGSTAATGGENAFFNAGGGGRSAASTYSQELTFSLPSTGALLRLLGAARAHLVHLLSRSKFKEAPVDLLRERWDGGVSTVDKPARSTGLQAPVLPGRTKKWKQFHGLRFQWVLEECLGTGLVEVFNTGSVGLGVRLTG